MAKIVTADDCAMNFQIKVIFAKNAETAFLPKIFDPAEIVRKSECQKPRVFPPLSPFYNNVHVYNNVFKNILSKPPIYI